MQPNNAASRPYRFAMTFLRGGAIVTILLWSVLSFAPFFAMVYGDLTTGALAINLLFGITSIASLGPLYLLFMFIAAPEGRRQLNANRDNALLKIGGFAAAWLLLYIFLA